MCTTAAGPVVWSTRRTLGTGGAIRNVRQHLDDTFLRFQRGHISSLDLRGRLSFTARHGGIGTRVLCRSRPLRLRGGRPGRQQDFTSFQEKPAHGTAVSD
jgi:NDP-sugar pyrophosphorylase family protein